MLAHSGVIEHFCSHGLYTPALGPDSVVIDAGANRGEFSRALHERFGCAPFAIEANPDLSPALRAAGLTPHLTALSDNDGVVTFNISRNPEGSSLLPLPESSVFGATLERRVEVRAVSLASFRKQERLALIDVLKLDIEGAEVDVLRSLTASELTDIRQISVEFHDDDEFHLSERRAVLDVIEQVRQAGFTVISFNRPSHNNVLFLGPALPIGPLRRWQLRLKYDTWPYRKRNLAQILRSEVHRRG